MYRLRSPISPKYIPVPSPTHSFFTYSPTQACSPCTYRWAQTDAYKAPRLYLPAPSLPIAFPLFRAQSEGRSYAQLVPQRETQEAVVSSKWSPARTPTAHACGLRLRASRTLLAAGGWDRASLRCLPRARALGQHGITSLSPKHCLVIPCPCSHDSQPYLTGEISTARSWR